MIDQEGRNINYLRLSVTDRCNLNCKYCRPKQNFQKKEHCEILRNEEFIKIVEVGSKLGINKIRITGGEPLVRNGIVELIQGISKINGIKDISITTNGVLLKKYAYSLKEAGLKRVNISLGTLNVDKYRYITGGGDVNKVIEGIKEAKEVGLLPIKINVVLSKGFNDDEIENFLRLTLDENIDIRFIELMPIGGDTTWAKNKLISNNIILNKFPDLISLDAEDKSSPAKYYKLPNAKGRIGLINPISNNFCSNCNRIRITADGKIKPCLHSDLEVDIKSLLRNNDDITPALLEAINTKPKEHHINDSDYVPIKRDMVAIGG